MQGKKLSFIKIEKENIEHLEVLNEIATETPYLGNLSAYNLDDKRTKIVGNNYLISYQNKIIGYVGLSEEIITSIGNSVSIYYAICKKEYGHGYGKLILDEIAEILKEKTNIDVIIANVNKQNEFGIRTIERANFARVDDLCDEEENQYHKYL